MEQQALANPLGNVTIVGVLGFVFHVILWFVPAVLTGVFLTFMVAFACRKGELDDLWLTDLSTETPIVRSLYRSKQRTWLAIILFASSYIVLTCAKSLLPTEWMPPTDGKTGTIAGVGLWPYVLVATAVALSLLGRFSMLFPVPLRPILANGSEEE